MGSNPMPHSETEVQRYHEDGLVIPSDFRMAPEMLDRMRAAYPGSAHGYANSGLALLRGRDVSGRNVLTIGH